MRDAISASDRPSPLVLGQFHGILTGKSDPTWPEFGTEFFEELYPWIDTVNSSYFALPLPRIEALRNRGRSRDLVAEMVTACKVVQRDWGRNPRVAIVSHSNGGVLAIQVARGLIRRGIAVHAIILMAPALRTGAASREIAEWLTSGMLEYALLVRPTRDILIGGIGANWRTKLYAWPWGSLGSDGWDVSEIEGVFPNIPETLDLPDMGHTDPVAIVNREWLYREIISPALGLAPWGELQPRGGLAA